MQTNMLGIPRTLEAFISEIESLKEFDARNQREFSMTGGASMGVPLLHLLVETVFFRAYRAYEHYVRNVFLCYCTGEFSASGTTVISFLRPTDLAHAEKLVRATRDHVEWGTPERIIQYSELYLQDGYPVKDPYTRHKTLLNDCRRIRNHIAHGSSESLAPYRSVIRGYYGVVPVPTPEPGQYLLEPDKIQRSRYLLQTYLDALCTIASEIAP